jgi:hypothetical protein
MDLLAAFRYPFGEPGWARRLAPIALVAALPLLGPMFALGYANLVLGRLIAGAVPALPPAKLERDLMMRGLWVMLISLICGVAVTFLAAPLLTAEQPEDATFAPALVQAFYGPSSLLFTSISVVVTAAALARYAATSKIGEALRPGGIWRLLRAEPALWISSAVVGFAVCEGPRALVWVLPLSGEREGAAALLASSLVWVYGLLIEVHLIAQAYRGSVRRVAARAAAVGYRW